MALFVEGNMIKELREKIGLSQEELSYGICAVSTLSKIEKNKYIFPLYKRLNGNAYEWRLDWTKPNMTTKGFASHKSRLKALKNGFYENIEHISLFAYMKNKTNLYEFRGNFQRKGQIELKSFLIENQFHIPVILTISKLQKKIFMELE